MEKSQEILSNEGAKDYINERKDRIRKFKLILHKGLNTLASDNKIKIKSNETYSNAMAEVSKHIELLEGNPTERQDITAKEKEERLSRLRDRLLITQN